MERFNTPLTKEAAKSLLALDLEDKVITSYEKLDEWYTAWGREVLCQFFRWQGQHCAGVLGGALPIEFQGAAVGAESGVREHWAGVPGDSEVRE